MVLAYSMTPQACRAHRALPADVRERVNRLILGLRLAPGAGRRRGNEGERSATLNTETALVRVDYKLVEFPAKQVVVFGVWGFPKNALAGVYERLRAARQEGSG